MILAGIVIAQIAYTKFVFPLPDTSTLKEVRIQDNAIRTNNVGISFGSQPVGLDDVEIVRQMDLAASTGAGWIRIDLDWSDIESVQGRLDWSNVDRIVLLAQEREMQVLGLPSYTPAWARPEGTTDKFPPDSDEEFARFAAAAVARYGSGSEVPEVGGLIRYWEIWNEPNIEGFWEGGADPERYAGLFNTTAVEIRNVDPRARILVGGLAPADDSDRDLSGPTFFRRFLDAGADLDLVDAVAVHPYTFPARPGETQSWNTWFRMNRIFAAMDAQANRQIDIWVTEYGAPTGGRNSISLEAQAELLSRAVGCAGESRRFGPVFLYSLEDLDSTASDRENHFGLITSDGKAKPSWDAITAITSGATPALGCAEGS